MILEDESALICDFAETYHIYDYRSLPVNLAATLAAGLRDESRIKQKTTEAKASLTNTLLAIVADHLSAIRHLLSDSSELPSMTKMLYGEDDDDEESKVKGFASGAAFDAQWQAINED